MSRRQWIIKSARYLMLAVLGGIAAYLSTRKSSGNAYECSGFCTSCREAAQCEHYKTLNP